MTIKINRPDFHPHIYQSEGELIHHINCNEFDNRACNLINAVTQHSHNILHQMYNRCFQPILTNCHDIEPYKYSMYMRYVQAMRNGDIAAMNALV